MRLAGVQEGEDRQYPAMIVGGGRNLQLGEGVLHVLSTVCSVMNSRSATAVFERPSAISPSTPGSRSVSSSTGVLAHPAPVHQPGRRRRDRAPNRPRRSGGTLSASSPRSERFISSSSSRSVLTGVLRRVRTARPSGGVRTRAMSVYRPCLARSIRRIHRVREVPPLNRGQDQRTSPPRMGRRPRRAAAEHVENRRGRFATALLGGMPLAMGVEVPALLPAFAPTRGVRGRLSPSPRHLGLGGEPHAPRSRSIWCTPPAAGTHDRPGAVCAPGLDGDRERLKAAGVPTR